MSFLYCSNSTNVPFIEEETVKASSFLTVRVRFLILDWPQAIFSSVSLINCFLPQQASLQAVTHCSLEIVRPPYRQTSSDILMSHESHMNRIIITKMLSIKSKLCTSCTERKRPQGLTYDQSQCVFFFAHLPIESSLSVQTFFIPIIIV